MTIQINGTSGISGVDGSATTPALQGTDTNTGISFGTDTVNVVTGGTTRATVDSGGQFLIGTTTNGGSNRYLTVGDTSLAANYVEIRTSTSGDGGLTFSDSAGGARGLIGYSHGTDALDIWANGSLKTRIDSSGNLRFNSGYGSVATAYGVRAWVCFNGNNGTLIQGGNVSSITDNATGNYTINFATNMPDSNYAAAGNSDGNTGGNGCNFGPPAVGSIGMIVYDNAGTLRDHDKVFAIIVR